MIVKPYDGKPATVGNGSMVALAVGSPDDVKKIRGDGAWWTRRRRAGVPPR
jgi:hypothetical protein